MKHQRNFAEGPLPNMHPKWRLYRLAALRHIDNVKAAKGGASPTVALAPGTDQFRRWEMWLMAEFRDLPWEFKQAKRGLLETVTVPCVDPAILIPSLNYVMAEEGVV